MGRLRLLSESFSDVSQHSTASQKQPFCSWSPDPADLCEVQWPTSAAFSVWVAGLSSGDSPEGKGELGSGSFKYMASISANYDILLFCRRLSPTAL